jgi:hypothetical protein
MDAMLIIGIMLLAGVGGFLTFSLLMPCPVSKDMHLVPFSVLPVQNALPSTKAYLELLAGQVAWMDSSVMQSMVLMYPDGDEEICQLCREMAQQYDFFTCMSLSQTQELLALRIAAEASEKKSADSCNSAANGV